MLRKEAHGDLAELMEESAVDDKEADTNMAELMDAPAAGHKLYNCKTPRNTISCCPRPHPERPLGLRRLQPAGESPCNQSGQRTPLIQTPTRFALCAASRGLVDQGANISLDKIDGISPKGNRLHCETNCKLYFKICTKQHLLFGQYV